MNGFTNFVNHSTKPAEDGDETGGREQRKRVEKKGKEVKVGKGREFWFVRDRIKGL
jgi:hypothetical protein